MIVIATNNGKTHLEKLLASIATHGSGGHKVCIVDTGSTQPGSLSYLEGLDQTKYTVMHTPYKGYDTGAYIWAYRNTEEKEFLFMHDSMEILHQGWVGDFTSKGLPVVSFASFRIAAYSYGFTGPKSIAHLKSIGVANEATTEAIFGPIFYATREAMDTASCNIDLDVLIPGNKDEQEDMERGWAMLFDKIGVRRCALQTLPGNSIHRLKGDQKMKKYLQRRL